MNQGAATPPKSKAREHVEKIAYMVLGGALTVATGFTKDKLLDTPDFALEASICAPVTKVTAKLVHIET